MTTSLIDRVKIKILTSQFYAKKVTKWQYFVNFFSIVVSFHGGLSLYFSLDPKLCSELYVIAFFLVPADSPAFLDQTKTNSDVSNSHGKFEVNC